jgi:microcystin-dependent protein
MAEPYLGEIRLFSGNFAIEGWAFCNGQTLPISEYAALFSLLGTSYGGNGTSTFSLPNLQSSVPMSQGQGPGLNPYVVGQQVGTQNTTLTISQMPTHTHNLVASTTNGTAHAPAAGEALATVARNHDVYTTGGGLAPLNPATIGLTGANQPFSNVQPFLAMTFLIALEGIYPSRN